MNQKIMLTTNKVNPSSFSTAPSKNGIISNAKHIISFVQNLYNINSIPPIIIANKIPHIQIILYLGFIILLHLIHLISEMFSQKMSNLHYLSISLLKFLKLSVYLNYYEMQKL